MTIYSQTAVAHSINEHDDFVHFSAHVGTSYMMNMVTYGALCKWTKVNQSVAIAISALSTMVVGYFYKLNEGATWEETRVSMFRNSLGVSGAVGSIVVFKF